MNPLSLLITEIIYRPIFNILIFFLAIFEGNLGIAIILMTLVIRFLLLKQTAAGNEMQKHMNDMQPKLKEIQEKYADDPQRLQEETMKIFKTQGMAPLKGCLTMLLQIPVFIGLFYVVRHITDQAEMQSQIYSFFTSFGLAYTNPANINTSFFGIDLLTSWNIILTVIASIGMYFQMQLTTLNKPATPAIANPQMPDMTKMMGSMNIFFVFMMAAFVYGSPSSIGLYIVTTTIFSIIQLSIQYKELLRVKLYTFFHKKK